jgi:hypothetical protein
VDNILSSWFSKKLLVFVIGSIALFLGNLESADWVIIATVYIGSQAAVDIVEKVIKSRT